MTNQNKERLRAVVASVIENTTFQDTDHFINDLGVDSMLLLEVVVKIEKEFGVSIPDSLFPKFQSLHDIEETLDEMLGIHSKE